MVDIPKSSSRAFPHFLWGLYQIKEETMIKTGTGQQNIIIIEIITDSREMLRHHIVHSDSREIELRTGNRNQYINKIIDRFEFKDKEKVRNIALQYLQEKER